MKKASKILKWFALLVVVVLVGLQFVRPARTNPAVDQSQTIHARLQVNPQVAAILDRSCQDCHSNTTRWPWYSNVAPVSWFVIDHVNHGRSHLNLSEWGSLDNRQAGKKLEEMCEEVEDGAMPLAVLHKHPLEREAFARRMSRHFATGQLLSAHGSLTAKVQMLRA